MVQPDGRLLRAGDGREMTDPCAELEEREARSSDDGLPVDGYEPAFGTQARAEAVGTGLGDEKLFQLVSVIGLVDVLVDVLSVAAQEIGGDAFEASPADGGRRLDLWKVAAKDRAVHAKEKQIALRPAVVFDRMRKVELEPVVAAAACRMEVLRLTARVSQPETAPSLMRLFSSIRRLMSAWWKVPSPVHVGQAPSGLLKAK